MVRLMEVRDSQYDKPKIIDNLEYNELQDYLESVVGLDYRVIYTNDNTGNYVGVCFREYKGKTNKPAFYSKVHNRILHGNIVLVGFRNGKFKSLTDKEVEYCKEVLLSK